MFPLAQPSTGVVDVIDRCIVSAASLPLRMKLATEKLVLQQREQQFIANASGGLFYQFPKSTDVGQLSNKEMKDAYTVEMSGEKGSAYDIYSEIKGSAPNDRCPLCGVGVVSSVDHYLPKSRYTDLSITPVNLVPSCNDCNKFKHIRSPVTESDQTLHPYFDNLSGLLWLRGEILETDPPAIRFYVDSGGVLTPVIEQRLRTHMRVLRLGRTFASNAAQQLTIERAKLFSAHAAGGADRILEYLEEEHDRYSAGPRLNSWQSAFFQALKTSQWLVDGGYALIPSP